MRCPLFALLLVGSTLFSQGPTAFRTDATLVTVPVSVTAPDGSPTRDLQVAEFRLFDNGVRREIRHVWREDERALAIGILVDISASQRAFLREHRTAVDTFVTHLLRPGDRAFIITIAEDVALESEYVGRPNGPGQVMLPRNGGALGAPCSTGDGLHLCGGTALWNGVYAAAHEKLARFDGARAMLILSDGNDTGSVYHLDQALAEVQRDGVTVYAIPYPDPLSEVHEDGLAKLTTATGGAEFTAAAGDYATALDRMRLDLRGQYLLGFSPDGAPGTSHELRVEVSRPGLTVRARREYVLPPK